MFKEAQPSSKTPELIQIERIIANLKYFICHAMCSNLKEAREDVKLNQENLSNQKISSLIKIVHSFCVMVV